MRPITVPASIAGFALRDDSDAILQRANWDDLLRKIFGKRQAIGAQYGPRGVLVNLLGGRGPIERKGIGDVGNTSKDRIAFGDITCAHLQIDKQVLTSIQVCWYSSPTFGASLLASRGTQLDMQLLAAALEEVIPLMRDGATE